MVLNDVVGYRELMTEKNERLRHSVRSRQSERQRKRFTHLALLLEKDLIILQQCRTEDNTRHALEIVYPFLMFRPLSAYVDHMY